MNDPRFRDSVYWGSSAAKVFHPFKRDSAIKSAGLSTLSKGRDSAAPAEALSVTALSGAVARLQTAMASTPMRKAERMMAPRFPGSSWIGIISPVWGSVMEQSTVLGLGELTTPSKKSTKGYLENLG